MARGFPDYEGGKSGLYLKPEWAAKEATDKSFSGSGTNKAAGVGIEALYAVTAGKKLYVVSIGVTSYAYAVANAELNQMVLGFVLNDTLGTILGAIGGNGGAFAQYNKVLVIDGGQTVSLSALNASGHACNLGLSVQAYEV